MFSTRFRWDLKPNRITLALVEKRRGGVPVLDLTESNPTRAGLVYPSEILQFFAEERILRYDPAPAGMTEAREAVARYYAKRGIRAEAERILLTASTSEAYGYLFKLLTDPGDEVLVPRPSYPLFEFLAGMESVVVRSYPLMYCDGWSVDWERLLGQITPRTRAIVVVNPNNPTGSFLRVEERERLARLSSERQIALISDEVFSDYAFAPDPERAESVAELEVGLAFALSGLSKIAGLPQMKLGWIVVAGEFEERRCAWERLEWIADTYLSVGTPVQYAAPRLLAAGESVREQIRARTADNLAFAREVLMESGANVLRVEGGWYATVQVPRVRSEEEWTLELLERANVLVQPGYFFDFETEAFLVVSLLTPPGVFQAGIRRLARFVI
ncbi:MAG: pyridoxal phosphate-dependent aminotransferase [Acidobacteriia bacterium]|nr:pyridoxal phosphate-dependent aminotransferase [Terriglobia bacterium]MBV8902946.1 pyridoxal phosphate-dependent aminotransferase [Terriglobia bacterium]